MKCQSFHQQYAHSAPLSQGRIYSVIIQVTSSVCLRLPVRQVSSQVIARRSEMGNAARAFAAGILNVCANGSSWKQPDTSWPTHGLLYLGENVHLHGQHSSSATDGARPLGCCQRGTPGQLYHQGSMARRRQAEGTEHRTGVEKCEGENTWQIYTLQIHPIFPFKNKVTECFPV